MIFTVLKAAFLLLGIVYGFSNTVKAFRNQSVGEFQMWAMGLGIVGFVTMHFWLGL